MYTPLKLALWALPFTTTLATSTTDSGSRTRDLGSDLATGSIDAMKQVSSVIPDIINSATLLEDTLEAIRKQNFEDQVLEETFAGLLAAVVANAVPDSIPDALTRIASLVNGTDSTVENAALLILNGLSVTDLTQNVLAGYLSGINSFNNNNPDPPTVIYPKKSPQDAPYTVPEAQLRAAIYIPPGFTYGVKRPILFVPGTGAFGGVNFVSNLGKLLGNDGRFDPVYLNVPGAMYGDAQVNSEYIAYAINYLGSITSNSANANDLAVIPWSQGNLDTQWALQYWSSTRTVVTDFISASADFHGTTLAYILDPALINPPLPPSVIQQEYDSDFVLTLRRGGGGSPYVPSTSVHSITDEIVQPQYSPFASADYFTLDLPGTPNTSPVCPAINNIAYSNNQIQTICAGQPGGTPYTHEGVLYSSLMYALTLDALTHDGPGRVDRLDLATVCAEYVAPGLSLDDVLATEGLIPLAIVNFLLYPNKVQNEPAVMQYAIQANAQCTTTGTNSTSTNTTSTISGIGQTSTTSFTTTKVSTTPSIGQTSTIAGTTTTKFPYSSGFVTTTKASTSPLGTSTPSKTTSKPDLVISTIPNASGSFPTGEETVTVTQTSTKTVTAGCGCYGHASVTTTSAAASANISEWKGWQA